MTRPIFDRTEVVEVLHGSCLGPTGTSAVIIGANKVGKTHLLDYVYRTETRPPDTLFCRLDVDLLIARLRPGEMLSDDTFVRHFLESLNDQVEAWIRQLAQEEPGWIRQLRAAELDAAKPENADDAEKLAALGVSQRALSARLRELESLRAIHVSVGTLLEQKDPLTPFKLLQPINQLHRLEKRILIIIDEFHRLLEQRGFSANLWMFLRGANSEGKLVALLASTTSLMDAALHVGTNHAGRRAFFNHYQAQPLVPFDISNAGKFLDWLGAQQDIALDDDQRQYLISLGGGSPYFLKKAFELFVLHKLPTPANRPDFERLHVIPVLEVGFHDLWGRCSAGEKELLRHLATPNANVRVDESTDRLEREGYLVRGSGARCEIFSTLFAKFVVAQGQGGGTSVRAIPRIGLRTIPTSLFIQQPDLAEPLVTFEIENPTNEQVSVLLACSVPGFSREKRDTIVVLPREKVSYTLSSLFNSRQIAQLSDPENAEVACSARVLAPGPERTLFETTKPIQLLAKDSFVFARTDPETGNLRHWAWLIAAWVTPNEPAIRSLLTTIGAQQKMFGYPVDAEVGGEPVDGPGVVRAQVAALYEGLRGLRIRYDNSATVFHQAENEFAQRVRLPAQSLADAAANCLDGCVLFASLLSAIGIEPVILFLRGHAIVGWKIAAGEGELEFIDTTMLDRGGFSEAYAEGQSVYAKLKPLTEEWRATQPLTVDTTRAFAILIDIGKEFTKRRLVPIR
jgi:hypothetical protein